MKKIVIATLIILTLLIIACTPKPEPVPPVKPLEIGEPEIISEVPEEKVKVIVEEPEEVLIFNGISAEAQALIDKMSKVKNYHYFPATGGKIYVDLEKDELFLELSNSFRENGRYFDRAYIKKDSGTVYAWCVKQSCNLKERNNAYKVEYANHLKIKTPSDLVNTFTAAEVHTDKKRLIQNNEATFVTFMNEDGETGEAWLHSFFGLPLSYTIDGIATEFHDIAINPALWKDLTIPDERMVVED